MASTVAGVEAAVGRAEGLVLVDTAGLSRRDRAGADAMASLREAFPGADLVLVLTADAKPADLSSAVERFSRFRPTRLLFTRLDETGTFGPLWSEAVRRDLPVCFLSFGPGIPEDFEPATAVRLADLATSPGTGAIGTGMLSKLDSRRRAAAA
jgi:flagellar biosynthesis protein FlhF